MSKDKPRPDFSAVGRGYVAEQISGLEEAQPGWMPFFYLTGSFEGDIEAARNLRERFDMPRPKDVEAAISLAKTRYVERVAIAAAERDLHEARMRDDWLYWIGVRLGIVKRPAL